MPLPLILGLLAGAAGVAGIGSGIHGAVKMKDAKNTMAFAKSRHEENMARYEKQNTFTAEEMDRLGKLELEILHSFGTFSDVFEQIKNRPVFHTYNKNDVELPQCGAGTLKEVSVGAGVLLGGLGGAGLGAAGGLAAAGATTAAVMALGTASTGTAIASLSGAALTNATLAALGGGAIAAGGGGIALGSMVLGASTLGVGLLVGGIIFNFTGKKISDKADEAWSQMLEAEEKINACCGYLADLRLIAEKYYDTLRRVNRIYQVHLKRLTNLVTITGKKDWNLFTSEEKQMTENTVLLVGLLYNMCKVELVLQSQDKNGMNQINRSKIEKSIRDADTVLADRFQYQ